YELNDDIVSLTFIGADAGDGDNSHLQMADAIYILALDTKTGGVKILGISRDTMADVDLYSDEGKFIDTERLQMAFSYAYGSDTVTGGRNTATSLSRLFYGLPFNDYFAINMNALITLNDTIGGVTLTSSMTFRSPIDGRTISEGETVTRHGKEADYYVRHRDTERLDSNNDRMQRQQEYIRAFIGSVIPAAKKDISVVSNLYNEIQVNSDSTLDLSKMTYLASTAVSKLNSATDIEYLSLRGEITEGEFAEMNVDNKTTIRTMLDVFYKPLADVPKNIN
ncbi:MAG: LCP family protein, partial [Ruminococcus sp.]|nr:LCP family protein [Ruminococcus sp.]